jgi:hypothetical protein
MAKKTFGGEVLIEVVNPLFSGYFGLGWRWQLYNYIIIGNFFLDEEFPVDVLEPSVSH